MCFQSSTRFVAFATKRAHRGRGAGRRVSILYEVCCLCNAAATPLPARFYRFQSSTRFVAFATQNSRTACSVGIVSILYEVCCLCNVERCWPQPCTVFGFNPLRGLLPLQQMSSFSTLRSPPRFNPLRGLLPLQHTYLLTLTHNCQVSILYEVCCLCNSPKQISCS